MMGYGPEDKHAVLELTYNYGVKEYDKGNAYAQVYNGHITSDVPLFAHASCVTLLMVDICVLPDCYWY